MKTSKSSKSFLLLLFVVVLVAIPLMIMAFGCSPSVTYIEGDDRVFHVPGSSVVIKPDGTQIEAPWDGYLISNVLLTKLYRKASKADEDGE